MDTDLNSVAAYYLRTPEGTVYGPVDLVTLCLWATDARVIPGCELSERQDVWVPVETVPELRLNWSVQLMDGSFYGPLNLLAIRVLALENSIPANARVCEKGMARNTTLNDEMIPLLVEEFHQMLAGCGTLLSTSLAATRRALQEAVRLAEERGAQLAESRARLEKTESDLAASVMSAADFGAKFIGSECALKQEQGKSAQLAAAKDALQKQMDREVAAAKSAASEWETKFTATERALHLEQERIGQELGKAAQLTGATEALSRRIDEAEHALREKEACFQQREEVLVRHQEEAREALCQKDAAIQQLELALVESKALVARQERDMHAEVAVLEKALEEATRRAGVLLAEGAGAKERFEKEQGAAVQQNEALRAALDGVRGQYEALLKSSARKEQESSDKLKQIEKQVKESTEQVAKTLQEMEQRERQYGDLKNEINQRKQTGAPRSMVVDVDVIHAEVLHAEPHTPKEATDWITPPVAEKPTGPAQEKATQKPGILTSVESRLQNELRQWETLNRDKKPHKKNSPKWF
jgi:hypothetical protein